MPVFYMNMISYLANEYDHLKDCNSNSVNVEEFNLCNEGADFIRHNRDIIIEKYSTETDLILKGIDDANAVVLFFIEPDVCVTIIIYLMLKNKPKKSIIILI